jgi:hypothetical protein
VQELIAEKYRIEKLIANVLNGEIVKENVKVVLSDNKKLILISFVALIQTLKADPEMVNLIYKTSRLLTIVNQRNELLCYRIALIYIF